MLRECKFRSGMVCELRRKKLDRSQHPITLHFCNNICVGGEEQKSIYINVVYQLGVTKVRTTNKIVKNSGCGGCGRKKRNGV